MSDPLDDVYARRFPDEASTAKMALWKPIVDHFQRFVDPDRPALDLGCDRGYFINHVRAVERWATDLRDMSSSLADDVRFVAASGLSLDDALPNGHFGTVFMSNYLEHLGSSDEVVRQFDVVTRLLRPGGRVIVLQPNIRFVGGAYWDYIDHRVALTEHSLVEAAELAGLQTIKVVPRFLPYSTRGALPLNPGLVRLYLQFPLAWRLLGKQTLYVGERP